MKFTDEHHALYKTVKEFGEKEIKPFNEEWEKAGIYPAKEIFKKMADLNLLGITKDPNYGGMGLDYSYSIVFAEALGHSCNASVVMSIGVQTDMATPAIDRYGSDLIKKEFLAPSISGDYVASVAVSEPNSGSDVASIKTSATKDGDDYIINGQKMWITNSTQADYFCTLVNTSNDQSHQNKSLIVIPANTSGVSVGEKIDKIGMRSSDTAPVFFDNVRVPQSYRIGEEGSGFTMQMQQFQEERLFIAASTLIATENCIKDTIEYCSERKAFGKPLLDNQVIHFKLAEHQTELESLRALIYKACDRFVDGKDVTMLASMAKLKSGRLIREVSDSCLQFWGGMGYTMENPVSQQFRDGRLHSIGGGSDEVMLQIISKYMNTLPKKS
tara:strand:- start:46 stop:1200 length:1155 start_codon:yes stop_codon:yes gene_type:complete